MAEEPKVSTVITSNTMTASSEKNLAIFQGSVKMVQGELVVHSDVMIVYFKEKAPLNPSSATASGAKSESGNEISYIEAKGKVRIEKGESRATSQHALYYKAEEKVILTGSPVAWQSGTRISGPKMTMFLKENRSMVEGGTRVIIDGSEQN
ncbi:LptA/OstA family protein [uncultured Nitrospira sp.]|uniref:LptA/OstA family protein n=1 Tax=uncultured Nitrospira sp. TaxID=157176 RepID=UPI0031406657